MLEQISLADVLDAISGGVIFTCLGIQTRQDRDIERPNQRSNQSNQEAG